MAVVNIPPDGQIRALGQIPGTMHVYNTGNPAGGNSTYSVTILTVNVWLNVVIAQGGTDSYPANNNVTYIQNNGPNRLQVLYVANNAAGLSGVGAEKEETAPAF